MLIKLLNSALLLKIKSRAMATIFMSGLLAVLLVGIQTIHGVDWEQQLKDLSQVVETTIRVGDVVFLASTEETLRQKLSNQGAEIFPANPNDYESFTMSLQKWLDRTCSDQNSSKNMYFLWANQGTLTVSDLGATARLLIFFFSFRKLVPSGQFIQLSRREPLVKHYCKAKTIANQRLVMIVIPAKDFQVTFLLEDVQLGKTIWLASNETRSLISLGNSDWNNPWWWFPTVDWSFPNHDSRGFTAGIKKIIEQNGIILVDKQATLGTVAQKFLRPCAPNEITVTSDSFSQMCPNISALVQ